MYYIHVHDTTSFAECIIMYFHNCSFGSFPFLSPLLFLLWSNCIQQKLHAHVINLMIKLNAVLLGLVPLSREVFSWHEGERDSGWEWCKAQQRKVCDLLCNCLFEVLINVMLLQPYCTYCTSFSFTQSSCWLVCCIEPACIYCTWLVCSLIHIGSLHPPLRKSSILPCWKSVEGTVFL